MNLDPDDDFDSDALFMVGVVAIVLLAVLSLLLVVGGFTMVVQDWSAYAPYFSREEFVCKHTGKCGMQTHFMDALLNLRIAYGKPMRITSGYRDKSHPVEAKKTGTGEHTCGVCCDVAVEGVDALRLLRLALELGFSRIGIQQKGSGRFLHLGLGAPGLPNPAIWSY